MSLYRAIFSLLVCFACVFWSHAESLAMSDAAHVLSVNPGVHSILAGNRASLQPRMDVPIKASVKSDSTGKAELMFPDDSIIAVAPGTEIELAEFVDTPKQENIVIDMTIGTARVITGEVSRRNPLAFTVNTPQAVIGIRGTVATISVLGDTTKIYLSETSGRGVSVRNRQTGAATSMRSPGTLITVTPREITEHEATPGEVRNIVSRMRPAARRSQGSEKTAQELRQASRAPLNPGAALSAAFLTDTDMASTTMASRATSAVPGSSRPSRQPPAVPETPPTVPSVPEMPPSEPSTPETPPTVPSVPETPPTVPDIPEQPSVPNPEPPAPAPDLKPGPDVGSYVVDLPMLAGTFTGGGTYVNQAGQSQWDISMKVPGQYALKDKNLVRIEVNGHFWGAQWTDPAGFGSEFTLNPDGTFGLANPGSVNISGQFTSNSGGSVTVDSSKAQWRPFLPDNNKLYPGGVVSGPITKR